MLPARALLFVACAAACAGYDTTYPMFKVSKGVPVDGAGALFPHYYKDGLVAPYACDTFAWTADNMAFVIKFGYVRALSWAVLPELNITRCYLWVDIDEAHTKSNHGMVGDQAKVKDSAAKWEAYVPGAGKGALATASFDVNTDLRSQWGNHTTLWGDHCYVTGQVGAINYPVRCAFPRVVTTAPAPDPVIERTWTQNADCSYTQADHDFAHFSSRSGSNCSGDNCTALAKEVALFTDPLKLRVTGAQLIGSSNCRVFFYVLHTETRDWMMTKPTVQIVRSTFGSAQLFYPPRLLYSNKPVRGAGFAVGNTIGGVSTCYTNDDCLYPRTRDRPCNFASVPSPVQPRPKWVRKKGRLVSMLTEALGGVTFVKFSASLQDCVDKGRKIAMLNWIRETGLTSVTRFDYPLSHMLIVSGVEHTYAEGLWTCRVVVREVGAVPNMPPLTLGGVLDTVRANNVNREHSKNLVTSPCTDSHRDLITNSTAVYNDECFYPYTWQDFTPDNETDACYLPPHSEDSDVRGPCPVDSLCGLPGAPCPDTPCPDTPRPDTPRPLPQHSSSAPPLCSCSTKIPGAPDWFCATHRDQRCYAVAEFKLCNPGFVRCRNPLLTEADFVQRTTAEACTCGKYSGGAAPLDETVCTDGAVCSLPFNNGMCSAGTLCSRNKIIRVTVELKNAIPSSLIGGLVAEAVAVASDKIDLITSCPAAACATSCPASIADRLAHGCHSFYHAGKDTSRSASTLGGETVRGKVLIDFDLLLGEPMRTDALVTLQENAHLFAAGSASSLSSVQAAAMRRLGLQQAVPVMRPVLRSADPPFPVAEEESTKEQSWWEKHVYLVALAFTLFLVLVGVVVNKRVRFADMVDFGASRLGEKRARLQAGMHGCYRRHKKGNNKKAACMDAQERSIDSDSDDEMCVDDSDPAAICQPLPKCAESQIVPYAIVAPQCVNGSSVDMRMSMRMRMGSMCMGMGMGMGMGMDMSTNMVELSSSFTEGVEMATIRGSPIASYYTKSSTSSEPEEAV